MSKQKAMAKARIVKLKPGTFIEIWWHDIPNQIVMLIEKPKNQSGELSLTVFNETKLIAIGSSQIVRSLETVKFPRVTKYL